MVQIQPKLTTVHSPTVLQLETLVRGDCCPASVASCFLLLVDIASCFLSTLLLAYCRHCFLLIVDITSCLLPPLLLAYFPVLLLFLSKWCFRFKFSPLSKRNRRTHFLSQLSKKTNHKTTYWQKDDGKFRWSYCC